MRMLLLIVLVLFSGACGGGGESPAEVVGEITKGLRQTYRVAVSLKASAEEPTAEDLALRKRIEDQIEQDNVGRLVSVSGGSGQMEIVVEVENTAEAIPRIQSILRTMGVARDASFKVIPPEESQPAP